MDRRQRKTRTAIFRAFSQLLVNKDFHQITVGEIISLADVGRATFYAHFETKDFLLKEFCEELFCHLFDAENNEKVHNHIFDCNSSESPFLHLLKHLQQNDNNILYLLSSQNNALFLGYFKSNLIKLVDNHSALFPLASNSNLPDAFWKNHIVSTFVETLMWWIHNGKRESAEEIYDYFFQAVS